MKQTTQTDNGDHSRAELIPVAQLDEAQRKYRKEWRARGATVRYFRVVATGDVIFTVDGEGHSYSETLTRTLDDYWALVLADRRTVGSVQ